MAPPSLMLRSSSGASTAARAAPIPCAGAIGLLSSCCRSPLAAAAAAARRARRSSSILPRASGPVQQQPPPPSSPSPSLDVEGADRNYCDDFECTSSPAVEQSVRSLARDIGARRWTLRLFQQDVTYSDGARRFKGSGCYGTRTFWPEFALKGAKATVTSIRMLDKGTAEIRWTVRGALSVFPSVAVDVVSVFKLNLLTGRVTSHEEAWDCASAGTSGPAAGAVAASRAAWAAKEASLDAGDGIGRAADSLSSLASMDEEPPMSANPNDPMKFFQGGGQQEQQMNDAITLATALAILWAVYKGFEAVEKLH